ncbi:sigma 54-interacting transcriptional regulator [Paraburkholderia sabiae]|uniref:Sigma 54-interacting transcriptional regulator n=1 Tax=Paraburkholderia sabiae TaxID=273251 RepID=A0ABU9Q7S9_9BURK|nr:sigma 54-interacting transcriptional regulator [Paraburkholderia sabiae]WJZ77899.1 sigma 54-interacting transcriptional regulator [Paraburkholderia sabiae]CAD6531429.1 Anaerobic nitric oxide reductase transcription regulator NorR [Paraburkholderia sabiae]
MSSPPVIPFAQNKTNPGAFVGAAPAFRQLVRLIDRVAPTDHALLIFGPTGSGKELVARRVHMRSLRHDQPFVDVNCGAIPEHLVEAELFGHVKGAFTGAADNRQGLFQQVGKGTLLLDEIGEFPLALQPKLLRVLETRTFRPIGSSTNVRFEGRVVAATHRDLRELSREGRFREDLFYRLAVFVLGVPGLEQRVEDIPALVTHFASQQPRSLEFSPAAIRRLSQHTWPGHIRQLRNLISQLSVLAENTLIDVDTLEPFLANEASGPVSRASLADMLLQLDGRDKLAAAEDLLIDRALERTAGNKSAAATLLGVGRKTIERRLKSREEHHREAHKCLEHATALIAESRFAEAIPPLRRCLDVLQANNEQDSVRRLQFDAYRMLGMSLRSVHGWLYAEATACYAAALAVGEGVCEPAEIAAIQFGVWTTQLTTLQLKQARATAQDMLQRAQNSGDRVSLDEAHVAMTNTLFWLGDSEEALACLARGNLLGVGRHDMRTGSQGIDLASLALTFEGLAAYQIGAFAQARRAMEMLIARASEPGPHAFAHAVNLQGASWLACLFDDAERLGRLASELESVSIANGFAFYRGVGQILRACDLSKRGHSDEAETIMLDGFDNHVVCNGGALFYSFMAWQHGELLLRAGRAHTCDEMLAKAVDETLARQERVYLGELLVTRARAQWAIGDLTSAEQGLRAALSTALAFGSVPARVDAARYLATLLQSTDRRAEAIDTLERGLRALPPDPTTRIASAVALLAELRQEVSLDNDNEGIAHGL